jgi:hypothetical protein
MNELMYRSEATMNIRPPHLKAYRGPPGIAKKKAISKDEGREGEAARNGMIRGTGHRDNFQVVTTVT